MLVPAALVFKGESRSLAVGHILQPKGTQTAGNLQDKLECIAIKVVCTVPHMDLIPAPHPQEEAVVSRKGPTDCILTPVHTIL